MTRAEHLQWAKERALAYISKSEISQAFTSMASDLGKHPDTANHAGIQLGLAMMLNGQLSTAEKMQHFIEGFN